MPQAPTPNILELNYQGLEWQKIREYLQRRKNSLLDRLVNMKSGEGKDINDERAVLVGQVREIDLLLAEEKRPLAETVGAAPFA